VYQKINLWVISLTVIGALLFPLSVQAQTLNIVSALSETNSFLDKFNQDPRGNSLAVIVLIGLIISLVYVGLGYVTGRRFGIFNIPDWVIPLLAIIGFWVAFYLTYIEITKTPGVCGPIGNCNSVQQSPYAYLFGIIPVGVLGAAGYLFILVSWCLRRFGQKNWSKFLTFCLWGFALFGTIFSIYLTFLEPFVIGASCIWCLSSAIIITIILLTTTGQVVTYSTVNIDDENSIDNYEEFEQLTN